MRSTVGGWLSAARLISTWFRTILPSSHVTSAWVAGPIDIQALRHHRSSAQWDNWLKDVRTELYRIVYEQPIYPKNLYVDRPPYNHSDYRQEVNRRQVALLHERGVWVPPNQ